MRFDTIGALPRRCTCQCQRLNCTGISVCERGLTTLKCGQELQSCVFYWSWPAWCLDSHLMLHLFKTQKRISYHVELSVIHFLASASRSMFLPSLARLASDPGKGTGLWRGVIQRLHAHSVVDDYSEVVVFKGRYVKFMCWGCPMREERGLRAQSIDLPPGTHHGRRIKSP